MESDPKPDPFETLHSSHDDHDERRAVSARSLRVRSRLRSIRDFLILVLAAFATAIVIETFFIQAFFIPSESMEQTLTVDDWVVVNKTAYRFGSIQRGDVIVFDDITSSPSPPESFIGAVSRNVREALGTRTPGVQLIKRVIALEGETIEIKGGSVYIDGLLLSEAYVPNGLVLQPYGPFTIPAGHVFVMGDNRNRSKDSRVFGTVPEEVIVGRALAVVWPAGHWSGL